MTATRMRRVLLVTSSYAPITIADMHRARLLAWELPNVGWEAEVLYPNLQFQRAEYFEPESDSLFNLAIQRHEAQPAFTWIFNLLNMRSIGWRALWPLYRTGVRLLSEKRFDLVYITTANFPLFCIGRRWAKRFQIPCVLDYHDPWVRDESRYRTTADSVKSRINALLSRALERYALRGAAGVVSVSPVYLAELRSRYGDLPALGRARSDTIPIGGRAHDFRETRSEEQTRPCREIVYVGAGGAIMAKSFVAICAALAAIREQHPELVASLKCRIYGTYAYWKEGDPKPLRDIAAQFDLTDVVEEYPARVGYLRAMELAQRSDGLLVLGVDDAGYMPSKLFTYALSGKPLLASLRADSPARPMFEQMPGLGHLMVFDSGSPDASSNAAVIRKFLCEVNQRQRFDRRELVDDFLAPAMARKHAALFERICQEYRAA